MIFGHSHPRWWPYSKCDCEQVCAGEGSVGPPGFGDPEDLVLAWEMIEAVGSLDGFAEGEIAGEHNVVAVQSDDQEAVDGPGTDAGQRGESCFDLAVGHRAQLLIGDPAIGELGSERADRLGLSAGEPGGAQGLGIGVDGFTGRWQPAGELLLQARENPPGGVDGELLADDLEHERAE